jgi:hypothetical protein
MGDPPAPRESQSSSRRRACRAYHDRHSARPDERLRRRPPQDAGLPCGRLQSFVLAPGYALRWVGILTPQAARPFPDIAAQFLYAVGAGSSWEASHCVCRFRTCVVIVRLTWIRIVPPRIHTTVLPASRFLPFCLARQGHTPISLA